MKHIRILILCIAFALLTGCAPAAQDTAAYAPDESERLVLYTSHKKEVWWPIVKEFESRTGIWVEVVQGGTNELLEQLQKEQDAPRADVMFGGGVESLEACRALFEPYVCRGAEQILPGRPAKRGGRKMTKKRFLYDALAFHPGERYNSICGTIAL